ncbi:MAG: peptidoglycan-associated lipoprotein Pal [Nitrospirae bacterium]|nr:peptidoglycan-associated lipoprotein Pal [Candidatus Manganitrophaceae bacterium]
MNRWKMTLLLLATLTVVLPACNRKMENSALKTEGTEAPGLSAHAAPSTEGMPRHDLMEVIPPSSSSAQVPKQTAMGVPKKALQLQDTFFDYDKALLRQEAKTGLIEDAKALKEHPETKVTIEGHCDERGTTEYNLTLGNRRAEAVKRYLIDLGVAPSQLSTISYGKEKPFCSEQSEGCYRENRRAHFVSPGAEN